ncbi:MAG: hypothetical protein Q4C89_06370 [Deinococcus sp.]|uniref:hypothetical protein n=1 Tax=Deinococcus sp. TaxID=47478 RepID=UPI0026DB4635|nr:hypothetical protein [Deinococcus sp.]MDO4245628.1 hypothetical protein [Deinococcus sp.]
MRLVPISLVLLLTGCAGQDEKIVRTWAAPPGQWTGLEVRAIDLWGGWGPNRGLAEQYLEVRCAEQPSLPIRRTYWPGPDWSGQVVWNAAGVTYQHGTSHPNIHNLNFRAEDLLQSLPCLKAKGS